MMDIQTRKYDVAVIEQVRKSSKKVLEKAKVFGYAGLGLSHFSPGLCPARQLLQIHICM